MDSEKSSAVDAVDSESESAAQRDTVLISDTPLLALGTLPPVPGTLSPAPRARAKPRPVSVLTAAVVTSAWAAVVSYAPLAILVALGWFLDGHSTAAASAAARFSGIAWLLSHGVPARLADGTFSLTPLALTVLVVWRLTRAGAHTARGIGLGAAIPDAPTGMAEVVRLLAPVIGAVAGVYGLLGALAATLVNTPQLRVSPVRALLTMGLLAAVASGAGALAESGLFGGVWRRVPRQSRHALRTAVVGVLFLVGVGAAAVGVAVAVTGGAAGGMLRAYDTGIAGQAGLTALSLVYAPTAAIWALSYLIGPGFAFGVGTMVSPLQVTLGPLPALPIVAGLPDRPVDWASGAVLLVPFLATALAGALLAHRSDLRTPRLVKAAILAGAPAVVLCCLLGLVSSGSLGAERLVDIGPCWWQLGLAGGLCVTIGASLGALGYRVVRRLRRERVRG